MANAHRVLSTGQVQTPPHPAGIGRPIAGFCGPSRPGGPSPASPPPACHRACPSTPPPGQSASCPPPAGFTARPSLPPTVPAAPAPRPRSGTSPLLWSLPRPARSRWSAGAALPATVAARSAWAGAAAPRHRGGPSSPTARLRVLGAVARAGGRLGPGRWRAGRFVATGADQPGPVGGSAADRAGRAADGDHQDGAGERAVRQARTGCAWAGRAAACLPSTRPVQAARNLWSAPSASSASTAPLPPNATSATIYAGGNSKWPQSGSSFTTAPKAYGTRPNRPGGRQARVNPFRSRSRPGACNTSGRSGGWSQMQMTGPAAFPARAGRLASPAHSACGCRIPLAAGSLRADRVPGPGRRRHGVISAAGCRARRSTGHRTRGCTSATPGTCSRTSAAEGRPAS